MGMISSNIKVVSVITKASDTDIQQSDSVSADLLVEADAAVEPALAGLNY